MDENEYKAQRGHMNNTKPTNKNELILFRLDAIDKKLVDLQVLMTQTALQEQKIAELESAINKQNDKIEDYALLKEKVKELSDAKKSANAKWWQVCLMVLSPIVTAIVVFALAGGFNAK